MIAERSKRKSANVNIANAIAACWHLAKLAETDAVVVAAVVVEVVEDEVIAVVPFPVTGGHLPGVALASAKDNKHNIQHPHIYARLITAIVGLHLGPVGKKEVTCGSCDPLPRLEHFHALSLFTLVYQPQIADLNFAPLCTKMHRDVAFPWENSNVFLCPLLRLPSLRVSVMTFPKRNLGYAPRRRI